MPDLKIGLGQFSTLAKELKTIYGPSKVNTWIRQAFGRPTPNPLKSALKQVTPRRSGKLRKSVNHQVVRRFTKTGRGRSKAGEPALFVGGKKEKGGFVYYFLRGTKERRTKKGAYRGRITNRRLDKKAFSKGGAQSALLFRNKFEQVLGVAVTKMKGKVGRAKIG